MGQLTRDEIVERCDLSYILEANGDLMFPVSKSAEENAAFLTQEFTALDILMTAMPLFSDDGAQLLWQSSARNKKLKRTRKRASLVRSLANSTG